MASPSAFSEMFFDNDETFWEGIYNVGFFHYNLKTNRAVPYYLHKDSTSARNSVYVIKQDSTNRELLWLATEDGIFSFNKKTKELKRNFRDTNPLDSSAADLNVTKMDLINRDTIWFSVPGRGFGSYNLRTGFYTMYPWINKKEKNATPIDILTMQRKSKNEYYIATEHNLPGIFNTYTHHYDFTALSTQHLPAVLLSHFLVDSSGNFWCVLYNRLFMAHSTRKRFATIGIGDNNEKNKNENAFKNIVWDGKRKYYYAAFERSNRIFVLNSDLNIIKFMPVIPGKNDPAQTKIYDLGMDKQNRLWVCGTSLYVYDGTSQRVVQSNKIYPKLLFHGQQFQNLVFRGNYLYLQPSSPEYRAIYRINLRKMDYDSIPLPDEMVRDNVNTYQSGSRVDFLMMDKEAQNAYMGYLRKSYAGDIDGIIQFNLETRKARRVTHAISIDPSNSTHRFGYALDDSDHIWAQCVSQGILVFEPGNFKVIKEINTVPETSTGQMCNLDGLGLMCRLYSDGVLLYDYKNNKEFHLTVSDGLLSNLNSGLAWVNNYLFVGISNYLQYIPLASVIGNRNTNSKCYLSSIQLFNQLYQTDTLPQYLHVLNLAHDKNFITLTFSSTEFERPERLEYRYKLEGVDNAWVYVTYLNRTISYNDLAPGDYTFRACIKNADGKWSDDNVNLTISIIPAWWQTNWFKMALILAVCSIVYWFLRGRIKGVRKQEQVKVKFEKKLLELEAKALRAQMNPHFIFNCMNSIKSLIQKEEQEKAVIYLTTFSKLIRTIFQNSDKREISLYDELETCRLYTQLESMRFGNKFSYNFNVDETIDLKSIMVPALIVQPFIENAIWHGIMPKEDGGIVMVTVEKSNNAISCVINDNGIGRAMSMQNKFKGELSTHQSQGVHLTQARLDLDNALNERNAHMEIIDEKDEYCGVSGTTVILTFEEY